MTIDQTIAQAVRQALAEQRRAPSPEDWLPHPAWPFPRKRSAWLASTGRIDARRDGRTWYARRRDVDAYVASLPRAEPVAAERPQSLMDAVRDAAKRSRGRRAA